MLFHDVKNGRNKKKIESLLYALKQHFYQFYFVEFHPFNKSQTLKFQLIT